MVISVLLIPEKEAKVGNIKRKWQHTAEKQLCCSDERGWSLQTAGNLENNVLETERREF